VLNERSLGPWEVQDEPAKGVNGIEVTVVVDRHGQPVANCGSGVLGYSNACLVAAAPELLLLLSQAVIDHPDPDADYASEWVQRARNWIGVLGGSSELF